MTTGEGVVEAGGLGGGGSATVVTGMDVWVADMTTGDGVAVVGGGSAAASEVTGDEVAGGSGGTYGAFTSDAGL